MGSRAKAPPSSLVARLARPSAAYKRQAWLAVAALAGFMLLYLGLAGWFLFTAWRLTVGGAGGPGQAPWHWGLGASAAFLAVFMLKAIFFVRHGSAEDAMEITAAGQPRLFEFLHKLADRAGAPRPHKVFVSARVNAAVFYDLSVLNLVLPSRKNLEIGLGLVNALTLGEMRAVLAHEFGHFAQKSMAVGRWVYVAQQVAGHLVARRDRFDAFLAGLSRFDLRIAWIGWALSAIVWAIRSLVDSAFSGVLLVQRALSREMEMQADRVAVSLTGSDALVHALHKLQAADDAWDRTLGFIGGEHGKGRIVRDAFAIQSRVMERMGEVLNDPQYHRVPPLPAERPDQHRVFKAGLAQPPRMWLSHPLNHEREANAKRHYIAAPLDDRSAWALFDAVPVLRERVTARLVGETTFEPLPVEASLQALEAQFARESLQGRYRGVYLGRPVARAAAKPAELVDTDARVEDLAGLYPPELLDEVEQMRRLEHEVGQLRALQAGALTAPGGLIRHRDRILDRQALPQQVKAVERELRRVEARLLAHDRRCRGAHRAAARRLGGGWEAYLEGLLALLHYAEHGEADLRDAHGVLVDAWQVESATRRVGQAGVARLLAAGNALQAAMQRLSDQRDEVVLDARMREALQGASWSELLGEFKLPPARGDALGDWLDVVDGWVNQLAGACGRLRAQALDQLLRTEAALVHQLQGAGSNGALPATAPEPSRVPSDYATLPAGRERERRTKLDWVARFQTANGLLPALARLAVAASIVGTVLGLGSAMGDVSLVVYNGLGTPVTVRLAPDRVLAVQAGGIERLQVPAGTLRHIEARSPQGALIEAFDVEARNASGSLVYNVASAAPLVERTAVAGRGVAVPDRPLGVPRWSSTSAAQVLEAAPRTAGAKGGGGTRTVLEGLAGALPAQQLAMLPGPAERARLVATHLRWDATSHPRTLLWLAEAEGDPRHLDLLRERLKAEPDDAMLLRAEQESVRGAALTEVCARHAAASRAAPDRPGLRYAAVRCEPDGPQKWQDFIEAHARWPAHAWLGHAAGYAELDFGRFADGLATLADARARLPALAPWIAMDEARLRRVLKLDDAVHMAELQRVSAPLRQRLAMESGGDADQPREFAELAQGRIEAALRAAGSSAQRQGRLLVLAAASEGADPALLPRALALPPGEDATSLWIGAALAMRAGQDIGPYVSRLERRQPTDAALMRAFLELVQSSRDLAMADRVLAEMGFHARAQAYAAGVVLLGHDAPAAWRDAARRLLFADERPYFS